LKQNVQLIKHHRNSFKQSIYHNIMAKICVFCSSSEADLSEGYVADARRMGQLLGERKHHLVYGGSHKGLMGEVSKKFAEYHGKITEVIPEMWRDLIVKEENAIVTKDLHERLQIMQDYSDAFITLPGGFGSLQELVNVLVAKQLDFHKKPLAIVNTNNFYTPVITQIGSMIRNKFAPEDNNKLFYVASNPEQALDYIENYSPIQISNKFGC
jgi:cytokinin riboside 5'-monophosphate phosphoribohydrolase